MESDDRSDILACERNDDQMLQHTNNATFSASRTHLSEDGWTAVDSSVASVRIADV